MITTSRSGKLIDSENAYNDLRCAVVHQAVKDHRAACRSILNELPVRRRSEQAKLRQYEKIDKRLAVINEVRRFFESGRAYAWVTHSTADAIADQLEKEREYVKKEIEKSKRVDLVSVIKNL